MTSCRWRRATLSATWPNWPEALQDSGLLHRHAANSRTPLPQAPGFLRPLQAALQRLGPSVGEVLRARPYLRRPAPGSTVRGSAVSAKSSPALCRRAPARAARPT
jgi:hypothetical protein